MSLVNTSFTSHNLTLLFCYVMFVLFCSVMFVCFVCYGENIKALVSGQFRVHNTILSPVVITLLVRFPDLIHLIIENLYFLMSITSQPLQPPFSSVSVS